MKVLLIDNYDSFTYNLVHLLEKVNNQIEVDVFKNNAISLSAINQYNSIVLSPGPGLPKDAGIMPELLKAYAQQKKIFGVCLGLQAIAEHYNCQLKNLPQVFHGLATPIEVDNNNFLFANCPARFNVGRYHSWAVDKTDLNESLNITAKDDAGIIMALQHQTEKVCGVQFHPESILSEFGEQILRNWLLS
jgi:anthranilate synthase component 2